MEYLIILVVVLAVTAMICTWLLIELRRRRRTQRDDMARVGDEVEVDPATAARRAEGKAAWTRISGGM